LKYTLSDDGPGAPDLVLQAESDEDHEALIRFYATREAHYLKHDLAIIPFIDEGTTTIILTWVRRNGLVSLALH